MIANLVTTNIPSAVVKRQSNERAMIDKIYQVLPIGKERGNVSIELVGKEIGFSHSQMTPFVHNLEAAGILSRRVVGSPTGAGGKISYWSLLVPKETAVKLFEKQQEIERQTPGYRAPATQPYLTEKLVISLKSRVLQALEERNQFGNVKDILNYIRQPNERLDIGSLTRVLGSLKDEGKISFNRDNSGRHHSGKQKHSTNHGSPYNIKLRYEPVEQNRKPEPAHTPVRHPGQVGTDMTQFRNHGSQAQGGPIEHVLPARPTDVIPVPMTMEEEYPLIVKLIKRQEYLEQAAELAENAGADEIALQLLEKAKESATPMDLEISRLWMAYMECTKGGQE